jgi:hypothetical protein
MGRVRTQGTSSAWPRSARATISGTSDAACAARSGPASGRKSAFSAHIDCSGPVSETAFREFDQCDAVGLGILQCATLMAGSRTMIAFCAPSSEALQAESETVALLTHPGSTGHRPAGSGRRSSRRRENDGGRDRAGPGDSARCSARGHASTGHRSARPQRAGPGPGRRPMASSVRSGMGSVCASVRLARHAAPVVLPTTSFSGSLS